MRRSIVLMFATLLLAGGSAWGDPPSHARGKGAQSKERASDRALIGERDRDALRDYYQGASRSGSCPPGLAKKNNGCQPPGQAKKWARGRSLPSDVTYHPLPADLVARLQAPQGTRFVRVAADILLIAIGTGMVLDAVEDLSQL